MAREVVVYGAYGATGRQVAEALLARGIRPLLSGRNGARLQALAESLNCHRVAVALGDAAGLRGLTRRASVVLHCAGPFADTAVPMRAACILTGTHYVDIAAEPEVIEASVRTDPAARDEGVMLLSAAGFDAVAADCLAALLQRRLPDATALQLAIAGPAAPTQAAMRAAAAMLGERPLLRRGGALQRRRGRSLQVDFGDGAVAVRPVTRADVVTAFHTTGIPEIEAFAALPEGATRLLRGPLAWRRLLGSGMANGMIERRLAALPVTPAAEGTAHLWGRAVNAAGMSVELRLETPAPARLTALALAEIAARVIKGQAPAGYQTPATAYGGDFVLALPGVRLIR